MRDLHGNTDIFIRYKILVNKTFEEKAQLEDKIKKLEKELSSANSKIQRMNTALDTNASNSHDLTKKYKDIEKSHEEYKSRVRALEGQLSKEKQLTNSLNKRYRIIPRKKIYTFFYRNKEVVKYSDTVTTLAKEFIKAQETYAQHFTTFVTGFNSAYSEYKNDPSASSGPIILLDTILGKNNSTGDRKNKRV